MISKEWDQPAERSAMLKAGQDAEKQMAFYLKREFSKDKDIFVFNGAFQVQLKLMNMVNGYGG